MSANSTPNRHPRGVPVHEIDTRASHRDASTAVQYGGWLTPPQSAHESRRPSLAYSSYSEMPYSAGSTATSFSLPPTPIHCSTDRVQHFSYPLHHGNTLANGLSAPFGNDHLAEDLVHTTLEDQQDCSMDQGMTWHSNGLPSQALTDFGIHASHEQQGTMWLDAQMPEQNFLRQPGSLQPTLFSTGQGLIADQHVVPSNYVASSHSMGEHLQALQGVQYTQHMAGCYPFSVLVKPSQISPEDAFAAHHYSSLSSPDRSPHDLSTSFSSVTDSFDSYDAMDPPSPDCKYYGEEEDAILVKDKAIASPKPRGQTGLFPQYGAHTAQGLPIRSRKRSLKHQRRSVNVQHRPNRVGDIDFKLEGDGLVFDQHDNVIRRQGGLKSTKAFKCTHVDDDGTQCRSAFDRGEHLKRHMGKHSKFRKFPCPLNDCKEKKGVGRSDNACDHFRTHMKVKVTGRRNKFCEWSVVKLAIQNAYEEKSAGKIIVNLQRWLDKGDAELQQAHDYGHHSRFRAKL